MSTIPSNHVRYEVIHRGKLKLVCAYCDPTDIAFGCDDDWRATCKCDKRRECEICKEQFIPIDKKSVCTDCPSIFIHNLSQFLIKTKSRWTE